MQIFGGLQKVGKALMLPIAVLPVAGLMLRLGAPDVLDIPFIMKAGGAIFENLAMVFGVGIAVGMSEDHSGSAGLAGLVGYLVLTTGLRALDADLDMGVLAGIIAGVAGGLLYNRFHAIKLPDYLGFFAGKRFVPIVTGALCLVAAFLLSFIWPPIQEVIEALGSWITQAGELGAFVYGVLNRLLIPVGLHHILNSLVWFVFGTFTGADGNVVTGDLHRFFAGDPDAGMFMAGFYPIMMFGLPAACLAMIQAARPENRRRTAGLLLSVAFTSFLTGITEPIEFTFMFLAPVLYVIHALLTGLSLALMDFLGVKHGFTFSAGLIDYVLNFGLGTRAWLILPVGLAYAAVYYLLFLFVIKTLDLATPGREPGESVVDAGSEDPHLARLVASELPSEAERYVAALGGAANLSSIDACITRLRLQVKDPAQVQDAALKTLGAKGVIRVGATGVQVIIGPAAEGIAEEIRKLAGR